MTLEEARELRQELEAVEAVMLRIKELACSKDFPTEDNLDDLHKKVASIAGCMDEIVEKDEQMPTADSFDDLHKAVGNIVAGMDAAIEKAEELPVLD